MQQNFWERNLQQQKVNVGRCWNVITFHFLINTELILIIQINISQKLFFVNWIQNLLFYLVKKREQKKNLHK